MIAMMKDHIEKIKKDLKRQFPEWEIQIANAQDMVLTSLVVREM